MVFRSLPTLVGCLLLLIAAACSSPAPQAAPTAGPARPADTAVPQAGGGSPTAAPLPTGSNAPTSAPQSTTGTTTAPPQPTAGRSPTAAPRPTVGATAAVPAPTAASSAGEVPRMKSPEAGVQVFMWGSPHASRDLDLAKDAGFTWVKQMFQWNYIEQAGKGKFAWEEPDRLMKAASLRGLKVVARLDYTPDWAKAPGTPAGVNGPPANYADFGDFVYALASRYRAGSPYGHIDALEIWNEPNLAREWGGRTPNAAEYVQLLKTAYAAAKRADPAAVVVTAGLSPTGTLSPEARPDDLFLEEMYSAGAKGYFDVLGVHAAGFKAPPEMSLEQIAANKEYGGQRFFGFRRVEDLRQIMVKNGDERKQVMVLEMGWSTDNRPGSPYAWHAVSEAEKGDYLVRAYQFAQKNWSGWIGMMSAIYISDPNWTPNDEQYYWALTNPDGSLRTSYNLIKGKLP